MSIETVCKAVSENDFSYAVDWATRGLGNQTIAASVWSYCAKDQALTISNKSIGSPATTTTAYFDGGTPGMFYDVTNTITNSRGEDLSATFRIEVVQFRYV